jgi:hypothetical protein
MRAAVLADIHGNLPALEAVLLDVERVGVDVVVLNGDIADGAMPAQTLERLAELGGRAIWVRGNTDRWLVDAFDGHLALPGFASNPQPSGSSGVPLNSTRGTATSLPTCRRRSRWRSTASAAWRSVTRP